MSMKKFATIGIYVLSFFVFFSFFVYLMFPYQVLKDSLLGMIGDSTGLIINAEELSPAFFIGADLNKISIQSPGIRHELKIDEMSITLNPLYLLLGKLAINFSIDKGKNQGELDGAIKISLPDLLQKRLNISKMSISSKGFVLTDAFDFFLERTAKAPDANPLLAGVLTKMAFEGALDVDVDLKIDASQVTNSKGKVSIEIKKGILKFNDPGMQIEDQVFNNARIIANVEVGKIVIDKTSGISSTGVDVGVDGRLQLDNDFANTKIDLVLPIKLKAKMKDQIGFLVDAISGKNGGGEVNVQIRGSLGQPHVTTI